MKHIYEENLQRALNAPVPQATDTYSPIPHMVFLGDIGRKIREAGFRSHNNRLYCNLRGTQVVGFTDIIQDRLSEDSFGMRLSFGFKNSYDKSMSAAIVLGASVAICTNGVIAGDLIAFKRKHTGNVLAEVNEKLNEAVTKISSVFSRLVTDARIMAEYQLTPKQKAEILGVMYFEEEIVSPNQLSIVKKELHSSETFKGDSLWDLYNHVTVALKTSPARTYVEDHIRLHDFMTGIAGIIHSPEELRPYEPVTE